MMMNTRIIGVILFLAGAVSVFALDISGNAPTFTGTGADMINDAVVLAFNEALNKLKKEAGNIDTKPENFIQSWGNSAVFASHGATQRAYGEYKLFSITLGSMFGLQLSGDPFNIMDDFNNLSRTLNNDHDIKLGVSPQVFNARIGINTSKFLLDKLYLGLHLGLTKFNGNDVGLDGVNYDNFSIGITANYQLVRKKELAKGLLIWRGVNVGSGFIYQGTKIGYGIKLDSYEMDLGSGYGSLVIDPKINLDMKIDTYTIPLEVTTAVRLLWFLNIPLGLGMDLAFGKSDINLDVKGNVNVKNLSSPDLTQSSPGYVSANAGGDMAPSFFNFKIMTGIGLNFGPVVLDVPVTFYLDNGYSVGVTLGFFW